MKTCSGKGKIEHIGIGYTASGDCPLCVCFEEIDRLRQELQAAANSLQTLATASKQTGFSDFTDVRGYANSRAQVAREALDYTD